MEAPKRLIRLQSTSGPDKKAEPVRDGYIIDFESRSRLPLEDVGADAYWSHPSTEILCIGFANASNTAEFGVAKNAEEYQQLCEKLKDAWFISFGDFDYVAWNAKFPGFQIPPDRFIDIQVLAGAYGLPSDVETVANELNLANKKSSEGHKLMLKMCKLDKKTGLYAWTETMQGQLEAYCLADVLAEREMYGRLHDFSVETEKRVHAIHVDINRIGVRLDRALLLGATRLVEEFSCDTAGRVEKKYRISLGSRKQVMEWAAAKGWLLDGYAKDDVAGALADDFLHPEVREVLDARQLTAYSSVKKYRSMLDRMGPGDRLRFSYKMNGAIRTGRWSAGGSQLHNFARGDKDMKKKREEIICALVQNNLPELMRVSGGNPMLAAATVLRNAIIADDGCVFVAMDYSAIEARLVMWVAGARGLEIFRLFDQGCGPEPYKVYASMIFRVAHEDVTPQMRAVGKETVLGCIGSGTRVLTEAGWKYIETIEPEDRIWNGERWARFQALIPRGRKAVIRLGNSLLTPDHLLMSSRGWLPSVAIAIVEHMKRQKSEAFSDGLPYLVENISWGPNVEFRSNVGAGAMALKESISYLQGKLECALRALSLSMGKKEGLQAGYESLYQIQDYEEDGEPHISISTRDALLRVTRTLETTGLEVSRTDLSLWMSSCLISLRLLGGTHGACASIGLTSMDITSQETFALLHLLSLLGIQESAYTWDIEGVEGTNSFMLEDGMVHNSGFGMSYKKFMERLQSYGIPCDEALARRCINETYRLQNPEVADYENGLWAKMGRAAMNAMRCRGSVIRAQLPVDIRFIYTGTSLIMVLPSGRQLHYWKPEINPLGKYGEEITYMTHGSEQGKNLGWHRTQTHGAKLTENCIQAISADLTRDALVRIYGKYPVRLHSHDEIVACPREGEVEACKEFMKQCMCQGPAWAKGLPIAVAGWVDHRFIKD